MFCVVVCWCVLLCFCGLVCVVVCCRLLMCVAWFRYGFLMVVVCWCVLSCDVMCCGLWWLVVVCREMCLCAFVCVFVCGGVLWRAVVHCCVFMCVDMRCPCVYLGCCFVLWYVVVCCRVCLCVVIYCCVCLRVVAAYKNLIRAPFSHPLALPPSQNPSPKKNHFSLPHLPFIWSFYLSMKMHRVTIFKFHQSQNHRSKHFFGCHIWIWNLSSCCCKLGSYLNFIQLFGAHPRKILKNDAFRSIWCIDGNCKNRKKTGYLVEKWFLFDALFRT